jgi:ketosteroid isomerase-like protein
MSEANAELLRRAVDAYNRRDVAALLEELDPDVEWLPALPGLLVQDAEVYRGHEGVREMFRDFHDVLDEIHFDYSDANLAEVRNGKGIRIQGYLDPERALQAAGLSD